MEKVKPLPDDRDRYSAREKEEVTARGVDLAGEVDRKPHG
jgi:hypothetical protein